MNIQEELLTPLKQLHADMLTAEKQYTKLINKVSHQYRNSAINIIDYLALRSQSIEALQQRLHNAGLSSLSSSESHIKSQIVSIIQWLNP